MPDPKPLLEALRASGCYLEDGHFKLVSGKHSDSYLQVRIAMMDREVARLFGEATADLAAQLGATALASATTGGLLIAADAASRLDLPLLVGRQAAKRVSWVNADEIPPSATESIVVVDDVLTTGGSLRAPLDALGALGIEPTAVVVVVDRSDGTAASQQAEKVDLHSLLRLSLNQWDPSECPLCDAPYVNLSNPEEDFLSVVLSMPRDKAEMILAGYERVYTLQRDTQQVGSIEEWRPWLPSLLAGLPLGRVGEDSGLVQFIRRVVGSEETPGRRRVLTELVGRLLTLPHIRVESRSLGCAMLIGDRRRLEGLLESRAPVELPRKVGADNWTELIPYLDALLEQEAVLLIDRDGELFGIRRLVRSTDSAQLRGIQLLRQATEDAGALGLLVRRGRKALFVYRAGRLEAIADLSEKTGLWEFTTPRPIVDEVNAILPGVQRTLESILEVAREMVSRGYGGLFVVGSPSAWPERRPPKVRVARQPLSLLSVGELVEIAKLDGAVFVTNSGELYDASVIIINREQPGPSNASPSASSAKAGGARRQTALRTSLECAEICAVCVSQNGTIEIFVQGRSWPVSEPITGVGR